MEKIRVLYIIDYLTTGGGTENQLKELISHLDRDRFDPFLVTLSRLTGWEGLPEHHNPGCPHFCLEMKNLKHPKSVIDIARLIRFIRRMRFDIIQTYFVDANIVGVIAGYLSGCDNILVSRRDMGYWYTPYLLFYLKRINRLADYILTNSDAVKGTVIEHEKTPPERVKVIRNGFFNLPDGESPTKKKSQLGIPENARLVGIVANLRQVKRIDNFIKVASSVQTAGTHFLVVGMGKLKESLIAQAHQAGIGDRFHVTHTLANIYDYIRLFDLGVLTSDSEGLSNTLIEYQLCGIPAVSFDVGGNSEIIEHEQTGYLIRHGDLDDMRTKIDLILSDEELRIKLGNAAREMAARRFSGRRMIDEYEEFYWMLIRNSRPGKAG